VDPCGENGEFHSFVYRSPVFSFPLSVATGEIVERDNFVFADVVETGVAATKRGVTTSAR
jgi:diphthamide synthase (EF-2-diphthine--ammonia ligase)